MFEHWTVITLLYTFIAAAYVMGNDVFRQDGVVAIYWRSLFSALALTPLAFFIEWPQDMGFYWLCLAAGLLAGAADIVTFQGVKHHGGSAISRMYGLRPIAIFFLWLLIDSSSLQQMTAAPLVMGGIVLCLLVSAAALVFAHRNPLSRAAFFAFLPPLILFTVVDTLQKLSAPTGATGIDRVLALTLIYSVLMTLISGGYMLFKQKRIVVPERVWLSGGVNGSIFIALLVVKTFGLSASPNPAYFNALSLILTLWTYLSHRFIFRREDKASPVAGFVVVASAAVLTILVEMLPK